MKYKYLILLLFLAVSKIGVSQNCDPAHSGVEVRNATNTANISAIPVGGSAIFKFELFNDGSSPTCAIAPGQFRVRISFPRATIPATIPYMYNGPATFSSNYFAWTYNATQRVLEGLNTVAMLPNFDPLNPIQDDLLVPVLGNAVGAANTPFNISALGGVTNATANDISTIPLAVVSGGGPLPVTLSDVGGTSENCSAFAKWTTENEINVSGFEIESSNDGLTFAKVGTVKSSAIATGSAYQFNWKQGGGKVFYRLKVIDKDGSFTYSKVVPILINCNENKFVKVYPNPVITNQKLNINITGYEASVKGELFTATGQLVKTFTLKNGANNVPVDNVAQGFYTLRISENGIQTEVFKLNVLK
jgi:Secretion system C-terminal sorting domain